MSGDLPVTTQPDTTQPDTPQPDTPQPEPKPEPTVQMSVQNVDLAQLAERAPDVPEFEKEYQRAVKKKRVKKQTKKELIAAINKLRPNKFSKRALTRMKKSDLEQCLAELIDDTVSVVSTGSTYCDSVSTNRDADRDRRDKNKPSNDMVVKTMYTAILLAGQLFEGGSKAITDYTGGYCLDGFAKNLGSSPNREQLIEICKELEEEHRDVISSYCSVETRLLMVFMTAAGASVKHKSQIVKNAPQVQPAHRHYQSTRVRENKPGQVLHTAARRQV